jgi:sulfatase modifying factor 1
MTFRTLCAFLACCVFLGPGLLATGRGHKSMYLPGAVRQNPKDGLKYVWIPPGTFQMGCSPGDNACRDDEIPTHQVKIRRGFWMAQTVVTVGAYKRFVRSAGRAMPPEADLSGRPLNKGWSNEAMPIVDVTWNEARDYCKWMGGRLPTEAEWEYAARGGSPETRYGALDDIAWYADNSGRERLDSVQVMKAGQASFVKRLLENGNGMREVAQKRPNSFGLYDTLGNVWEWVNDWYQKDYYAHSPKEDPQGPSSGQYKPLRGWSFVSDPTVVRVSLRSRGHPPDHRGSSVGFRCIWNAPAPSNFLGLRSKR